MQVTRSGRVWILARSDSSLQSYLPLSAAKLHIWLCPEHSLFSFNRTFMRPADNLDRHKISFEFQADRTIDFGVIYPLLPKTSVFDLVRSLDSYWIFMKFADNLDRHKISDEFEFRQYRTVHFGITCSWVLKKKKKKKKKTFNFVRRIAYVIFI